MNLSMAKIATNPNIGGRISRDKINLRQMKIINIVNNINNIIIKSRMGTNSIANLNHNLAKNGALNSKK
jgi:hypothetical protein